MHYSKSADVEGDGSVSSPELEALSKCVTVLAWPLYLTLGPRGSKPASFPAGQFAIVKADPRSTIAGILAGLVENNPIDVEG